MHLNCIIFKSYTKNIYPNLHQYRGVDKRVEGEPTATSRLSLPKILWKMWHPELYSRPFDLRENISLVQVKPFP